MASQRGNSQNPYQDPKEKALANLTDLYVKDQISLDQFETLAAEIQRSTNPDAVLDAALSQHLPHVDSDASTSKPRMVNFADNQASEDANNPFSPRSKFSFDAISPFNQHGKFGDFYLCIMADRRIEGEMLASHSSFSLTLMGSTTIDLRNVEIPDSGLRLELIAIMGEVKILVSPETSVHFSVVPIMGEAISKANYPVRGKSSGILEVAGMSLMGSVSIRVIP